LDKIGICDFIGADVRKRSQQCFCKLSPSVILLGFFPRAAGGQEDVRAKATLEKFVWNMRSPTAPTIRNGFILIGRDVHVLW
jgi:hypothetical protein